jgi:hypothetical protein
MGREGSSKKIFLDAMIFYRRNTRRWRDARGARRRKRHLAEHRRVGLAFGRAGSLIQISESEAVAKTDDRFLPLQLTSATCTEFSKIFVVVSLFWFWGRAEQRLFAPCSTETTWNA